ESILDQFPDSVETRNGLYKSLESIIPADWVRLLNPKPLNLLRHLLRTWAPYSDARILDLFAGTGSMLLATILENQEVLENRKNKNNRDNKISNSAETATRQTIACQYPFSLSDFFRLQNQDSTEYRHRSFIELTLQRLDHEIQANLLENITQIRFHRQILKPRPL
ncbi:MAG: hypothetical protein ACTSYI_11000, partial [Promethearchaeota archaeon]